MGEDKEKKNGAGHSDIDDEVQIISEDELEEAELEEAELEEADAAQTEEDLEGEYLEGEDLEGDQPETEDEELEISEAEGEDQEEEDQPEEDWDEESFEEGDWEEEAGDTSEDDEFEFEDETEAGEEDDEEEGTELTEAEKALERHRKRKRIRRIFLALIGIVALLYLGVSAYFFSHFYLNTTINGADFSLQSASQVQDHMKEQVAGYVLTMKESDGGRESIDGKDISLEYVKDDSVEKLLEKQNPFLWITALWDKPEIEASIGVKYDKDQLSEVLENLDCMEEEEQTPSVSAHPEFQDTEFEIKEEQIGTQIDNEKFIEAVNTAISGFQSELDLMEAGCYILPKYTSDSPEVAEACKAMNSYLGANITLDFTPHTEVVDSAVISQWITVDDNMQVTFNQEAVRTYIASLAEKYDTYGKSRTFVTGYGNTVQVDGGSYGWQIDQEAEYNALTANIQNAETVTREPNYARRGVSHEGNDFGNTYAEVDLTNQHMFFFKDGQCVMQTDIVTGNPNHGNATPQGVYSLAYKAMNQVLRGPKQPDGTYEWESPVTYWMPFNGGIGFHDANWQSAFGGSRYLTYGSHGCVNMPPASAGELYNYIEAGTPVVCHY